MAASEKSTEACVARIAAAGKIAVAGARRILDEVDARAEKLGAAGVSNPYAAAALEFGAKAKETARLDRLDAIRNATKLAAMMDKTPKIQAAAQVAHDIMRGSNVGHRENAQTEWLGRAARTNAAIDFKLTRADVLQAAITGEMDRETSRAMWALKAGTEADASAPAKAMADAYHPAMEEMRRLQNTHGARIGDAPDFVFHTYHDPILMRRGGRGGARQILSDAAFAVWRAWTEPKLAEKTFDGIEDRGRFMRSVFNALVSGIHMSVHGASGIPLDEAGDYVSPWFEGTHNIARKVSQQRVLFWKDADAWFDYNQKYGRYRTLYEGVQQSVNQASRNIALMDKMGTTPEELLNKYIRRVQEKFRDVDLDGVVKFQKEIPSLQNEMARLDGSANRPIYNLWHSLGEGARDYYNSISLGGVGITHAASIWATVPGELRQHGIGAATDRAGLGNITGGLANIGHVAQMLVRGKGPLERQEIASDWGAYAGGYVYNIARNWNLLFEAGNTPMGRITALHNLFMKATGVHWVFETVRAGVREFISANLGRQIAKGFGELHPLLQQMLGKYGIGAADWDQLRALPDLRTWEGRTYITPRDALRTEGGQALADKLMMYIHDAGDHAVVVPGVRERAALYGKERPGDPGYEMRRMLMQFKIWPLAASNQILGREIHMNLTRGGVAWGIGLTAALSMAAGYTRMAVTDLLYGNQPRNPLNATTMMEALAQGGGLGIMGDMLFGEANRMGASGISSLGGPLVTDADALFKIYGRWRTSMRTGQKYNYWPDLANFLRHHIPFANLVYLKGALDYMLWYHMLEAASPGYWERSNRRMQIEQGRTLAGYVPGGSVPYGVPGVYMQNRAGQSFGLLGQH